MKIKNSAEEAKVIHGCVQNDRWAQEKMYKTFFSAMMRMCRRYTSDDNLAMEIVNDGFLKVFKKIGTFSGKGSLEGWIRRIVFHTLSDHFRKKSSKIKFIEIEDKEITIKDIVTKDLYYDDLMKLINSLSDATKNVFVLYAIEGYTHKEIGERLGISDGTSKWHLSNARMLLKEMIIKQEKKRMHA